MRSGSCAIVRKRKFDGTVKSEWEGDLLPSMADGWLVVLHHPEQHLKVLRGAVESADLLFLHCFNIIHPLTVLIEYDLNRWFRGAKCDAALPATQEDKVIEFVDLDLDVIVKPDLTWSVRDEKTFARNREIMGYPETVIEQAHKGILLAQTLVALRRFPFDEYFIPYLDESVGRTDNTAYSF